MALRSPAAPREPPRTGGGWEEESGRVFDFAWRVTRDAAAARRVLREWSASPLGPPVNGGNGGWERAWRLTMRHLGPAAEEGPGASGLWAEAMTPRPGSGLTREQARAAWDVCRAMDPRHYALLDLALRRQLQAGELAEVLRVPVERAAESTRRLRDEADEAARALLLVRGREGCPRLDGLLGRPAEEGGEGGRLRQALLTHARECARCGAVASAWPGMAAALPALAPVAPSQPPGVNGGVRPRPVPPVNGGEDPSEPFSFTMPASGYRWMAAAGAALFVAALALFAPVSPLSPLHVRGSTPPAVASEDRLSNILVLTSTPAPAGSRGPGASRTATPPRAPVSGGVAPTATAVTVGTFIPGGSPTATPGTVGSGDPAPSSAGDSALTLSTRAIDLGSGGPSGGGGAAGSFTVSGSGGTWQASSDADWLSVSPTSGTLTPSGTRVAVSADRDAAGPGAQRAVVRVSAAGVVRTLAVTLTGASAMQVTVVGFDATALPAAGCGMDTTTVRVRADGASAVTVRWSGGGAPLSRLSAGQAGQGELWTGTVGPLSSAGTLTVQATGAGGASGQASAPTPRIVPCATGLSDTGGSLVLPVNGAGSLIALVRLPTGTSATFTVVGPAGNVVARQAVVEADQVRVRVEAGTYTVSVAGGGLAGGSVSLVLQP